MLCIDTLIHIKYCTKTGAQGGMSVQSTFILHSQKKKRKKNTNQTTANFMCNHTMLFGVQYKTPNKYYIKLGIC